jgi:hypothetical protein
MARARGGGAAWALAAFATLCAALSCVGGAEAASAAALRALVDPRILLPGSNRTAFTKWQTGTQYRYHFESKAAHIESALPVPEQVNPQTALEDLGLFPFAVLRGELILECKCADAAARRLLFKATIDRVEHECAEAEARRNGNSCRVLSLTANSLGTFPFWVSMSYEGEVLDVAFDTFEGPEARAVKKTLVNDFSLASGDPGQRSGAFTRETRLGDSRYTTQYRIDPFTRNRAAGSGVDGLVVRKTRTVQEPPAVVAGTVGSGNVTRRGWVYMVVGGDVGGARPAPVPTRVSSTEEARVDPNHVPPTAGVRGEALYVLSRVELELRQLGDTAPMARCEPFGDRNALEATSLLQLEQREAASAFDRAVTSAALGLPAALPMQL